MKLSIIVPTHNRPDIAKKVLKKFPVSEDIEILLVENGSLKKNVILYDKYFSKMPNVRLFHLKKGNLPNARNFGVKNARGDYIFHIDDDDAMTNEFKEFLKNEDFREDIYRMPLRKLINGVATIASPEWKKKTISKKSVYKTSQSATFLIKRSIYHDYKLIFDPEFPMGEDILFKTNVFKTGVSQKFLNIISIDFDWFNTESSMTRGVRSYKIDMKVLSALDTSNYYENACMNGHLLWIMENAKNGSFYLENEEEIKREIQKWFKQIVRTRIWAYKKLKKYTR